MRNDIIWKVEVGVLESIADGLDAITATEVEDRDIGATRGAAGLLAAMGGVVRNFDDSKRLGDSTIAGLPILARPLAQLRSGSTLFFEEDEGDDVFYLAKGTIAFYRFMSDAHRVTCGFALAGEVFSMSHQGQYICTAEALSDCLYRRRSRKEMEANDNQDVTQAKHLNSLHSELWTMQLQTLRRLHLCADENVANFILEIGQRTNPGLTNGSTVRLEMSRADIASYLGLTVETVVRSLKRLTSDGLLIAYTPHEFGIRDIAGLYARLRPRRAAAE